MNNDVAQKEQSIGPKSILLGMLIVSFLVGGVVTYGILSRLTGTALSFKHGTLETVNIVEEESGVIDVVDTASPAVVSIIASAEVPTFETYYRDPFGFGGGNGTFSPFAIPEQRQNGTEKRQVGAGTGFLVSADGYIVTNKHVVEDEDAEYTVFLNDEEHKGDKLVATVVARDPDNDIAILKIDQDGLPYLSFGDSAHLKVGQTALTIGYSLGEFDNTVSKGVISGLSRSITASASNGSSSERLTNLIQTDAAINPGNSGGPMLDSTGHVIGVNVAMATGENIGFAIPSSVAEEAYTEARDTGAIAKDQIAFLGVRYVIVDESIANANQLPFDYGALIQRGSTPEALAVSPGSPADKADLVENDIILEVDGKKISSRNLLSDSIRAHKPGDTIHLKVYHKGDTKDVDVTLSSM